MFIDINIPSQTLLNMTIRKRKKIGVENINIGSKIGTGSNFPSGLGFDIEWSPCRALPTCSRVNSCSYDTSPVNHTF